MLEHVDVDVYCASKRCDFIDLPVIYMFDSTCFLSGRLSELVTGVIKFFDNLGARLIAES